MGPKKRRDLKLKDFSRRHPNLPNSHYQETSPYDNTYNCLAFAAGETQRWWHPCDFGGCYWPTGVQPDTLESWIAVYEHLGYVCCDSRELEPEHEKVALFVKDGEPTHAARQLDSGYWTSKMGKAEDVEHALEGLEGGTYGHVAVLLKRARNVQHSLGLSAPLDPMEP